MSAAAQAEFAFASLAFPPGQAITVRAVAERLNVSTRHVINLVAEGELTGINISGKASARPETRILPESWLTFVNKRLSSPAGRVAFLRSLPAHVLDEIEKEIQLIRSMRRGLKAG